MGLAISEHSYCRHALNGLATGGWRSGVRVGGGLVMYSTSKEFRE